MNNKNELSILKIFHMAWYDMKSNISTWLYLISLSMLIVFLLVYLSENVTWFYIDIDLFKCIYSTLASTMLLSVMPIPMMFLLAAKLLLTLVLAIAAFLLPIVLIQNALDLAFDSKMQGFVLRGSCLSWFLIKFTGTLFVIIFIVIEVLLLAFLALFLMPFLAPSFLLCLSFFQSFLGMLLIILIGSIVNIPFFILWQRIRFAGLHMLEYKTTIADAFRASWKMTDGKIAFLIKISLAQGVTALLAVDIVGLPIMLIIVYLYAGQIDFDIPLSEKIYHSFSALIYLTFSLLTVFSMLTEAHVYRQLVAPASENSSCESCDSCPSEGKKEVNL